MSNQKMTQMILKDLFKKSPYTPQHHTYVIKKEHLDLQPENYVMPNSERKISSFRIQVRSKSQNRTPTQQKISPNNSKFKVEIEQKPIKRDILRVRSLKNEKVGMTKKYKSVQQKVNTISPKKNKEKEDYQMKNKHLKDYVEFIMGTEGTDYVLVADFERLRRRGKKYKISQGQKKVFELLQDVFLTLEQTLMVRGGEVAQTIQQQCLLYLQSHQKASIQLVFSIYYPKLLHTKLRPYLVYQRQLIYLICLLNRNDLLSKMNHLQLQTLKILIKYTRECLTTLMEPLMKIENETVTQINQTFIILKAIGEVEKKLVVIQKEIMRIFARADKELASIENSLYELIKTKREWQLQQLVEKEMELSWKYFKIPPIPFLPSNSTKPYTLVIELTNTLIFYQKQTKMLKYRPYIDIFLTKLKEYFEIVIYTTASHEYTQIIIRQIEKVGRYFDYCLCEAHLVIEEGKLVKDYGRIGRDKRKMVIIDHVKPTDKQFRTNFLQIGWWSGDKNDRSLYKLTNVLWELQLSKTQDVRVYLRDIDSSLKMIAEDELGEDEMMI